MVWVPSYMEVLTQTLILLTSLRSNFLPRFSVFGDKWASFANKLDYVLKLILLSEHAILVSHSHTFSIHQIFRSVHVVASTD